MKSDASKPLWNLENLVENPDYHDGGTSMIPPSNQEPPPHLDPTMLENLRRQMPGQPDILTRIIHSFFRVSPELLASLCAAIRASDPEAICRAAHTMKSSNGQIGANKLAAMCHELEILGSLGHLPDAEQVLAQLEQEYQGVVRELEMLLARYQQIEGK